LEKTVFDVKFDALRNAVYHASRRRFFELLSRSLSFLVVVSGTAAVASVAGWDPRWPAAGAAVIGALQLVFDFNGRARLHEGLQRRYFELIASIEGAAGASKEDIAKWRSALGLIYADEPPSMKALDAIAYNKACDSLGCSEGRLHVWLLQQFYSFPDAHFPNAKCLSENILNPVSRL
jgi:hypothetical protein